MSKNITVHHFSGGRSSGLAVLLAYSEGDLVIFCDTEREDPKTYKFINDYEAHTGIPIVRIKMENGWQGMLGKMKGIPNRAKRRCTLELKIKTARRYLRSLGFYKYTQTIGFRYDEQVRVKGYRNAWVNVTTRFPLNEVKFTEHHVLTFWANQHYTLEIPKILSNCDACFMKGEQAVIAIFTNDISKADKWIADEENTELNPNGYTYFKGVTMRQLRDMAQGFIDKGKVFDLTQVTSKFNCSCGA